MNPILLDLPDEILAERVLLRPYQAGDGGAIFEAVDESRDHILPWLPFGPFHSTPEDSEQFARRSRLKWDAREDLGMAILDKATGRFLGGSGLHRIDWSVGMFEIGYWIRQSEAGKGYVTEAARTLTHFAFSSLNANRVWLTVASGNERSSAVASRLGFMHEGTLRDAIRTSDGLLRDRLAFGMVRAEWLGKEKGSG